MQNLLQDLYTLLAQDPRLVSEDGTLFKNLTIELGLKLDPDLLRLLLSHDDIRRHFFTEVDSGGDGAPLHVFDKDKFLNFVNHKEFLPDSYTAFKNKIGLSDDGGESYLSRHRDVTLVWPYKDCVLEGGQTKEDAQRDEIFWNTTLAPDDIDRLLDPKVLTNFRRVDAEGEHEVEELQPTDNLIIKGNNLLSLHSLKRRFRGKVKLIYIDPPFNTGTDSFGYNDRFNHSTWLTFMKARLEIARLVLSNDGLIFVQCDDNEQAYLKVLLDEIFDRSNFIATCVWQKIHSTKNDAKHLSENQDYILVYAKKEESAEILLLERTEEMNSRYTNPDNDPRGPWQSGDLVANEERTGGYYDVIGPTGKKFNVPKGKHWVYSQSRMKKLIEEDRIWFGVNDDAFPRKKRFLSEVSGRKANTWWSSDEVGHNQEGKRELKKLFAQVFNETAFPTPKPERLIQRIVRLTTKPGDVILDFFLGSGTTAAVAHKMGRQYIGVEQMDYIETITIERLKKVIAGEQGGISEDVDWQGGGDFVYCELSQWNERYIRRIEAAASTEELWALWQEMQDEAFLSYRVDVAAINAHADDFTDLTLDEQKRFLLETLEHNALYVNLSEMDDVDYAISTEDKRLNAQFYSGGLDV